MAPGLAVCPPGLVPKGVILGVGCRWAAIWLPGQMAKNACFVKSAEESYSFPDTVEEWEYWDGEEWQLSETTVTQMPKSKELAPNLMRMKVA